MSEHPILFTGEMVRAILNGRKTQTRRIIVPQPEDEDGYRYWWKGDWDTRGGPRAGVCTHGSPGNGEPTWTLDEIIEHSPYGKVGDTLWVREGFAIFDVDGDEDIAIGYRADDTYKSVEWFKDKRKEFKKLRLGKWRPSIHMHRWATRIFLEITNIRVERVQDISWEDIIAEGCDVNKPTGDPAIDDFTAGVEAIDTFHWLWDSINAKRGYGWDKNSWVWVVEFSLNS